VVCGDAELDIIRAERRVQVGICGKKALSRWRGTLESVAEVLEVFRCDFELQNFFDHRREVRQ